jgi:lyso-ornithine lipid O-acyltransferase
MGAGFDGGSNLWRALAWARGLLRGTALAGLIFSALALKLLLRLIEAPLFGPARPITPFVTQIVCRAALPLLGLHLHLHGRPMTQPRGLIVANHASWLDIFVLNAALRVYFVAKSEVAHWAVIGWLARATGTLFIARKSTEAKRQQTEFETRLQAGHRLLFFPEGTSTDSTHILPFKPTLFAAAFAPDLGDIWVQPASLVYHPPKGVPRNFYGWYGDMDFAPHLWAVLCAPRAGRADLILHAPLRVANFKDRKDLAKACEASVRAGFGP